MNVVSKDNLEAIQKKTVLLDNCNKMLDSE